MSAVYVCVHSKSFEDVDVAVFDSPTKAMLRAQEWVKDIDPDYIDDSLGETLAANGYLYHAIISEPLTDEDVTLVYVREQRVG